MGFRKIPGSFSKGVSFGKVGTYKNSRVFLLWGGGFLGRLGLGKIPGLGPEDISMLQGICLKSRRVAFFSLPSHLLSILLLFCAPRELRGDERGGRTDMKTENKNGKGRIRKEEIFLARRS